MFYTTVGIEFTYMPRQKKNQTETCDLLAEYFNYKLSNKYDFITKPYNDHNVVEIPSPIFTNKKSLRKFYNDMHSLAEQEKLVYYRSDTSGGGGHIHLGFPKGVDRFGFIRYLATDVQNRPYLNWIFNEPNDTINANNLTTSRPFLLHDSEDFIDLVDYVPYRDGGVPISFRPSQNTIRDARHIAANYAKEYWQHTLPRSFPFCYHEKFDTIEWRMFEMSRNWEELEDFLGFALKYTEWNMNRWKNKEPVVLNITKKKQMRDLGMDFRLVRSEFKALCIELGLDYNRYDKYIKRNYIERRYYGRRYLT